MRPIFLASAFLLLTPAAQAAEPRPDPYDIFTWPRADAAEFGCMLEKTFHHKDAKYNCSLKNYTNHGDPCVNQDEYYDGPEIPDDLAAKIASSLSSLSLSWTHGSLQSLSARLSTATTPPEKDMFGKHYPTQPGKPYYQYQGEEGVESSSYKNVQQFHIGPDSFKSKEYTAYSLTGYDFMDASSTDCDSVRKELNAKKKAHKDEK